LDLLLIAGWCREFSNSRERPGWRRAASVPCISGKVFITKVIEIDLPIVKIRFVGLVERRPGFQFVYRLVYKLSIHPTFPEFAVQAL